jgi:gamma-glutamylcyclotransferase (GGCT)/AIG2-like uncharacterized protein YtfP
MGKFGFNQIQNRTMYHLFVYGTLQYPEILKKLTGKTFVAKPAVLTHFKRHKVKNAEYPAIVPKPGAQTTGMLIENVDESSLNAIDFYEGDEYEKTEVNIISGDFETKAFAYVWIAGENHLEKEDWDRACFEKKYLELYIGAKS